MNKNQNQDHRGPDICRFGFRLAAALGLLAGWVTADPIPGLFNTGVNDGGALLAGGAVDPHWRLIQSADGSFPGPNAYVVNDAWPVQAGVWMLNGPDSKWLAPQASQATGNQPGDYVFRITFDLTGLEPTSAEITGRWSSDNAGTEVRLNGVSTGVSSDGNFGAFSATFTIGSGFREGVNTLDFVVNNAGTAINPIGFRAELSGTADPEAPPGTPPEILEQPAGVTVGQGDAARFQVRVYGSKPLGYQWRRDGAAIAGATNASLVIASAGPADAGDYDVVVSNAHGTATSEPARLELVYLSPAELTYEPLGPCTRRTALVISEIMYHPAPRADDRNLEFIELYNSHPYFEDLSGYRLTGELDYVFPEGTRIEGMGFLVVAVAPADVEAVYGISGVLGGVTNRLANSGGTVRLRKRSGAVVLDVAYNDQPPWPAAADGAGHSLVLARPSFGERDPYAWAASAAVGGSPGGPDPVPSGALENVVINEILANTDLPLLDYVELYNNSSLPVDVSGCWLSDDPATNKYGIPAGTVLAPGGFVAFDENELGFRLSADGETIFFVRPDGSRVVGALRYGGQANGVAYGRHPDGADGFQELAGRTPGEPNAAPWIREVVINEIMYHPVSEDAEDEYLELYNRGLTAVDLGGWRFMDGIDFAFPAGMSIPAGGYVVVARNAARLLTTYPGLDPALVVGDYGGSLSDAGERLALGMPELTLETNQVSGDITTNIHFVVVDEVTYVDGGKWGRWSDGGGSSLELVDARSDNRLPANWAESVETDKAGWTAVEFTGTVDHAITNLAGEVQLFLLGEGEALVDDVEVVTSGVNRVPNSNFETGVSGWFFQGTQSHSTWEPGEGYGGGRSLRLRSSDRGEPIGNRARAPLSTAIGLGTTATLRARVRWLAGAPEFLMRLKGGGLEATARLEVPPNLGTPGAANSRVRPNAGPSILGTTHRPVLPAANTPIRVTTRVADVDGVASVTLRFRIDPDAMLTDLAMVDDGTGGDLLAGDGVYTAVIPGQGQGATVAFRIEAADGYSPAGASRYPSDAPARECLVRVGESFIAGPFGNYRIWMTRATLDHWAARGNLSNDPLDVTFVYGDFRVIYNAGSQYAGSPAWSPGFNSPIGNLCAYDVLLPDDDLILNEDHLSLDLPIRDSTNQREQLMHWVADQYGLPNLYRRDIYWFVNGVRRGTVYHDTQQPGDDVLEEWFPGEDEGTLVKTTQWSEGTDGGAPYMILLNSLEPFVSGGQLKVARYRWNWRPRAADSQLDYGEFLALVDAANAPESVYPDAVERLVDLEDWMRMFAMNDICSYWDGLGNPNSKNTFMYKAEGGKWRLIPWDFDVGLGVFNDPVNAALFPANVDAPIRRMYATPAIVRAYWRALEEGVNGFFNAAAVTPILQAKYAAFQAYGVSFTSPFVASGAYGLSVPDWITQRRSFLLTQLAGVAAAFAVAGPETRTNASNLLHLTGTAPVAVHTLTVNGVPFAVDWSSVTGWAMRVPLAAGENSLVIEGWDRTGSLVPGASRTLSVLFEGGDVSPVGTVVINEIMYNPLLPGAAFVELWNTSATHAFDLSGWRINGLGYTFPAGTVLTNGQYLVLAKSAAVFGQAFGTGVPVFAEFNGTLDNDGETLTLLMPGAGAGEEIEVDRVTYSDAGPWPAAAAGTGPSLQLVDARQDNSRVSNWTDGQGWRYFQYSGPVGSSGLGRLSFFFDTAGGDLLLDDVYLVEGETAEAGPNLLGNGGFEAGLTVWKLGGAASASALVTDDVHSGNQSLHLVINPGQPSLTACYQDITPPTPGTNCTLSFWFKPGSAGTTFNARMNSLFYPRDIPVGRILATPGAPNAGAAPVAPYPLLWLSEVQPDNRSTLVDNAGEADPWIEIHNSGSEPLSLDGIRLSDTLADLAGWAFPAGAVIQPDGHLVVWADGQPEQSDALNWHAGFRLNPTNGSVYLTEIDGGAPRVLDFFHYRGTGPDQSYGAYPSGQNSWRQVFDYPTPGGTNNPAAPPVSLSINEWMASNNGGVRDPADQDADDWFELFNPNDYAVDLAGYRLTDNPANPEKFVVPAGFTIPARGFLVVWADEEGSQNAPPDQLHVNFRLSAGGETLLLFAPDGRMVDGVVFEPQTADVSEGRFPDGGGEPFHAMQVYTPGAPNRVASPVEPVIQRLEVDGGAGTALLEWAAEPQQTYRVQYKDNLDDAQWLELPGTVTAIGGTASATDATIGGRSQRFYRVVRGE